MKSHFYLLFTLGVLLIGSSCTTLNRTKNVHFSGVDEKGELFVSGASDIHISSMNDYSRYKSFQFQAAYSPIKHLVFSTSNSFFIPNINQVFPRKYKGYDLDIALGTYKKIGSKSVQRGSEYFMFDAYLTYGREKFSAEDENPFGKEISYYNKYAIQLGIHCQNYNESKRQVFKFGFIYKPTLVEYRRLHLAGTFAGFNNNTFEGLRSDNTTIDNEIAFRLEFGKPKFRIFINHSNRITEIRNKSVQFDGKNFQVGLILNFNNTF